MRIEEGRDLVPVSDENLLRVIPFFLQGIALSWFRGSKHLWRTFNQFAKAFRVRFRDSDFQFELRQEIHLRTQGEKESVSDYLTCMRVMFDKLNPRMSEAEEVSYAHRNMLPRLHLAVQRNDIEDFTHLEYLANAAQKSYRVARSYKPPPVPERSLLPDLAYKDPNYRKPDRRPANQSLEYSDVGTVANRDMGSPLVLHPEISSVLGVAGGMSRRPNAPNVRETEEEDVRREGYIFKEIK